MVQNKPTQGQYEDSASLLTQQELEAKRQELEAKRESKRKQRRSRLVFLISLVALALILAGIAAYYTMHRNLALPAAADLGRSGEQEQPAGLGRFDVVIMGADEKPDDPGRTDTIMVASIDLDHRRLSVISVPRDTMVSIPNRSGKHRINAAHAFGGPELTVRTLADFLDLPLEYYVKINFAGFTKIVDTLGGVTVDVEKPMYYEDKAQNLLIDLKAGRQTLTGEQALGYVRYRHDGLGDVALVDPNRHVYEGRVDRQQKFVKAFLQQLMQAKTVTKVPALLSQMLGAVETNIPYTKLLRLALIANDVQNGIVNTGVIPGTSELVNGASYWVANQAELDLMVERMILGKDKVTVEVLNGSGVSGAAGRVAARLREQGYAVIGVADARSYDYNNTEILARPAQRGSAEALAQVLETGNVTVTENLRGNNVDLTVIVGKDYPR